MSASSFSISENDLKVINSIVDTLNTIFNAVHTNSEESLERATKAKVPIFSKILLNGLPKERWNPIFHMIGSQVFENMKDFIPTSPPASVQIALYGRKEVITISERITLIGSAPENDIQVGSPELGRISIMAINTGNDVFFFQIRSPSLILEITEEGEAKKIKKTTRCLSVPINPDKTVLMGYGTAKEHAYMSVNPRECIICCEAPRTIRINPCGHFSMCEGCFLQLRVKQCPNCKGPIESHTSTLQSLTYRPPR